MAFKFCPECGFKFDKEYKFCPECGYKFGEASTKKAPEPLFDFSEDTAKYDDGRFGGFDNMLNAKAEAEKERKAARSKKFSAFDYEEHTDGTYSIKKLKDVHALNAVIPEGTTAILAEAFAGTGIISVALPEGLMQIGDRAFKDCKNLMQINFPGSLLIVGDEAFSGCESLDVVLPSTVKKSGKDVMKGTLPEVARQKEAARKKAEAERIAAAEAARKRAEAEAEEKRRKAEAERLRAEAEKKAAAEAARKRAEAEAEEKRRKAEAEKIAEKLRIEAEKKAAAEAARKRAEAEAEEKRRKAEAERQRAEAERKAAEEIARMNSPVYLSEMGDKYFYGTGVAKNYAEAINWYKKAQDRGSKTAAAQIKKAEEILKKEKEEAERLNSPQYQNEMGNKYFYGTGVPQSFSEAVKWYKKAAEQGYAPGQAYFAYCYATGKGVEQSYHEAAKWYKKAAEQGDKTSCANLGNYYKNGYGVAKNYAEAIKWYKKAAELGHDDAPQKIKEIEELQLQEAEAARKKAEENRIAAAEAAKRKAEEEQRKADQAELRWARNNLLRAFFDPKDFARLKAVAEKGYPDVQASVGRYYSVGTGTAKNRDKAIEWYEKAAMQSYAEASYALGFMYYDNENPSHNDIEKAAYWFKKAYDDGYEYALKEYEKVNNILIKRQKTQSAAKELPSAVELFKKKKYAEAVPLFKKLAEAGNAEAKYYLGWCYMNGKGIPKNENKAFDLYEESANAGYAEAQFALGCYFDKPKNYTNWDESNPLHWYDMAAEQDYPGAAKRAQQIRKINARKHRD